MPMVNGGTGYRDEKNPRILYFTRGMVPTPDEKAEAATFGKVLFRNVRFISPLHPIEPCDYVAGAVPASYAAIPLAVVRGEVAPASPSLAAPQAAAPPVPPPVPPAPRGRRGRPAIQANIPPPSGSTWGNQ